MYDLPSSHPRSRVDRRPVLQFRVLRELFSVAPVLHGHHEVVPRIYHVALQALQQPWNAENPPEQSRGAECCLETTRFEETRVESWYTEEGYHEFARFVGPVHFTSVRVVVEDPSPSVKAGYSQRQDWRLTDEEIVAQVRCALILIMTPRSPHSLFVGRSCWADTKPQGKLSVVILNRTRIEPHRPSSLPLDSGS